MTDMPESQAGPSAQALVTDTVEETVTETPSDVPAVFVEGQMEVDGESDRPGAAGGEQDEANAAATTGVPPIPPASDVFAGIPAAESNTATSSTLAPVQPFQPSSSAPLGHEASTSTVSLSDRSNQAPTPMLGRQRAYRTGYIYDIMMMLHCQEGYTPTEDTVVDAGDGHPEEPMRIKRIFTRLKEAGLIARMKKLEFEEVTQAQAVQVHTEEHWEKVEGTRGELPRARTGRLSYPGEVKLTMIRYDGRIDRSVEKLL
jgi:histone deacetylase 6